MNCDQMLELLSPYIDNELDEKEKAAVEDHMAACEKCKREYEVLRGIVKETGKIKLIEVPEGFSERLHQALIDERENAKSKTSRKRTLYWRAASIAAIFIILVAGSSQMNKDTSKIATDSAPQMGIAAYTTLGAEPVMDNNTPGVQEPAAARKGAEMASMTAAPADGISETRLMMTKMKIAENSVPVSDAILNILNENFIECVRYASDGSMIMPTDNVEVSRVLILLDERTFNIFFEEVDRRNLDFVMQDVEYDFSRDIDRLNQRKENSNSAEISDIENILKRITNIQQYRQVIKIEF